MSEVTYIEFLQSMRPKFDEFMAQGEAGAGNKTAALAARKLSISLRKDLQSFREKSVANDKLNTTHRPPKAPVAEAPAPAAEAPAAGV